MAALSSFTNDLETQLTCIICNEIFTDPRTLPCLHTFCFNCIKIWDETCQRERKKLKCPTCRAAVKVEQGDISKLPSSFTYSSLIQLFATMKFKAAEQTHQQQLPECANCSNRSVLVGFCPQCEGMICNDCISHHKTMNTLKRTHQATLFSDFKKQNVNCYINNQAFCNERFHNRAHLEYFCKTCKKCICQKCGTTTHNIHDKISIEEAAEEAKILIRKEKDRLNELLLENMKELELSDENMRRIQHEADTAKTKVRNETRALMKILHDHEDSSIATIDKILSEQIAANEEEKGEINSSIQQASQLKLQCERIDDELNLEHFILEGYENLRNICKTTVKNKSILSSKSVKRNSGINYNPNPEVITQMQKFKFGEVVESVTDPSRCSIESIINVRCGFINEFKIVTRNLEGNVCYTNKGSIDVQIQDVDGDDVQKELTESETGRFLVKYRAEKPSPYKVVVSIGGEEISNSPQNIETIDAKAELKPLRLIGVKKMSSPFSLAVSERGDIAVVNNDLKSDFRVLLFSADGEYLREIGGDGQLSNRLCRAVFNENHIFVSDNPDDGGCIKEFDFNGTYKRTLCKLPKGMMVTGMSIDNQIILCASFNLYTKETFIKAFASTNGNHLHEIKLDVPDDGQEGPFSLVFQDHKYFVAFADTDNFYCFDQNGSLLYKMRVKENKESQFRGVFGLAMFGKEMLLACDPVNNCVQVFNQDGQFISSFGSNGSGLGHLKVPVDVAVAPDGRVFVLEHYGKRVQVWR